MKRDFFAPTFRLLSGFIGKQLAGIHPTGANENRKAKRWRQKYQS
jgi:hypothetical protein